MSAPLRLALPSKGRLMDDTIALFAAAGFDIRRDGRGYRGHISGIDDVEMLFLSASEIAGQLMAGEIDAGVTGLDLLHETLPDVAAALADPLPLGFGHADVIVAAPESWLDCAGMDDLAEIAEDFFRRHGRRIRVATKYLRLTRRFFAEHGIAGYRTVMSAGATEGAPAAGMAELIVDITSTGSTLQANQLKVLDDGVILRSEAALAVRRERAAHPAAAVLTARLKSARRPG
ncbi:MAG TPA: ATP phosphoribosyltransferase [Thermopetrobacter sp.]|nr:ATP phosphoribosyltransferase [Thermopetrobacter sp.]